MIKVNELVHAWRQGRKVRVVVEKPCVFYNRGLRNIRITVFTHGKDLVCTCEGIDEGIDHDDVWYVLDANLAKAATRIIQVMPSGGRLVLKDRYRTTPYLENT